MNLKKNVFKVTAVLMIACAVVSVNSCSSSKPATEADFSALTQKIESEGVRIEMDAAFPFNTFASQQVLNSVLIGRGDTANRIDLQGDGHYLEISADQVKASLPFFGERRQGGNYMGSGDSGIQFESAPRDYKKQSIREPYGYKINFVAVDGTENYDVEVLLYANGNATAFLWSNMRTRIEYRGRIVDTPKQ